VDLASARASALDRQPAVAAAVASLQAAVQRQHALVNLRVPTFLARDLPIRRDQADHGVAVAEAGVTLARMNASYSATYCYLSYLYALEQEKVTTDAIKGLDEIQKILSRGKEPKAGKETPKTRRMRIDRLHVDAYMGLARARQEEARGGAARAASALREAMGLCADAPLTVRARPLPDVALSIDRKIILSLAQSRRPEIAQAQLGADVACLEVDAQRRPQLMAFRVSTFASGSDLHSTPLPSGQFDHEYRPGAVGPEMPITINGGRKDRVAVAEAYAGRANTVVDRTKLLIGLEAEQAYLRWEEAAKRLAHLRKAVSAAQERAEESRLLFEEAPDDDESPKIREVLDNGNLASTLRGELNKARYEMLLGLAQLERVTAGGFCARLDTAPDSPDDAAAARDRARKRHGK
jgi:outer membrane protein TolC